MLILLLAEHVSIMATVTISPPTQGLGQVGLAGLHSTNRSLSYHAILPNHIPKEVSMWHET